MSIERSQFQALPQKQATPASMPAVTWRAVVIGLVLIPLNCYWVIMSEEIWDAGHPTTTPLFFNTVFSLFIVLLINLLLERIIPSTAMHQGDLLTIYAMLCVATAIAGRHFLPLLIVVIPFSFWFATPENEWAQFIHPHMPPWLSIGDKKVLQGYYEGHSTLYTHAHLSAWLTPIFWWSLFILALLSGMLCLCVIVRKQWVESEKLAYPVIQVPLAMTDRASGVFKAKLLWVGFAIAAGIDTLNGLHFLFPAVPYLHVKMASISHLFTDAPWNAIGWIFVSFNPFVIGMSFFLPLDLAFSLWFFFVFRKALQVAAAAAGGSLHARGPTGPFFDEQAQGAWLGVTVLALWLTRRHFASVLRQMVRPRTATDRAEGGGYRWAFGGLIASMLFLFGFSFYAGMSPWVILVFFIIAYAIFLALSRARAESAPAFHNLWGVNASEIMINVFGSRRLGASSLSVIALFRFFNRNYPSHPMPEYLENLKIGERANIPLRHLVIAMMLATVVAIPVSSWILLDLSYEAGAPATFSGWEAFGALHKRLSHPSGTNYRTTLTMGLGFGFTLFLMAMRHRFLWWPFHPVGYAFSVNFGTDYIWLCLLISSAAKWAILKYGGLGAHRKAIPFFLGLILGEFVVGSFWSALGIILHKPPYTFSID
jgi:hypothetical protein